MSEPWELTTQYGRADLTLHPLIREAYKVACLIERCGASPELTAASCAAFGLSESLSDYFRTTEVGRNADELHVLRILGNGQISVAKARELISDIRRGANPHLPAFEAAI